MPTSGRFEFDYDHDPDSIVDLLRDPEFLRTRSESSGDFNVEIEVAEKADGIHLTIHRDRTIELPSIVKGFVSPTNRAVENTHWHKAGEHWVADYSVEVNGLPGKVSGRTTLLPTANGCHYVTSFEAVARVPLVARKIESMMIDGFLGQLSVNSERNRDALRERPPSVRPPKPDGK